MRMERGDPLCRKASAFISLTPAEAAAAVEGVHCQGRLRTRVMATLSCNRDELNGRPETSAFAYENILHRLIHGTQCANILNAI